jgi:hypothetical protein
VIFQKCLLRQRCVKPEREFAPDSPLEGDGFELVVPLQRGQRFRARHSVSQSTTPVPSVLISENDDFAFPAAKVTSLAKALCVVLNGWCIEACVGNVTGWAIGAGGDFRKLIRDCLADGGARESQRPLNVRPSQRGGSGRQRRSGMIGRNRPAAMAVARSPRSTHRSGPTRSSAAPHRCEKGQALRCNRPARKGYRLQQQKKSSIVSTA